MRVRFLAIVACAVVLSATVVLRADSGPRTADCGLRTADCGLRTADCGLRTADCIQLTSNDGIYTTAQADGAKAQYDKLCLECHAFTVAAKKKPEDLPLGDEPFFKTWQGKSIDELVSVIVLTMPNDGSAVVNEDEALNLMAYVLQQNGFPAGTSPLTKATASAVLARPKR